MITYKCDSCGKELTPRQVYYLKILKRKGRSSSKYNNNPNYPQVDSFHFCIKCLNVMVYKETARKLTESIGLDDSLIEKAKKQTEANK